MYAILCAAAGWIAFATGSPAIGLAAIAAGFLVQCMADRWLLDRP